MYFDMLYFSKCIVINTQNKIHTKNSPQKSLILGSKDLKVLG
jgi:hypothetical protein